MQHADIETFFPHRALAFVRDLVGFNEDPENDGGFQGGAHAEHQVCVAPDQAGQGHLRQGVDGSGGRAFTAKLEFMLQFRTQRKPPWVGFRSLSVWDGEHRPTHALDQVHGHTLNPLNDFAINH